MKRLEAILIIAAIFCFMTVPAVVFAEDGFVANVMDYGAKGNGYSNDTQAIEQALAAAREHTGGIVYFPAGSYRYTSEGCFVLDGVSDLEIRCDGGVTFSGAGPLVKLTNCQRIKVGNLVFENTSAAPAVEIRGSVDCTFGEISVNGIVSLTGQPSASTGLEDLTQYAGLSFDGIHITQGRILLKNLYGFRASTISISKPSGTAIEGNYLKDISVDSVELEGNETGYFDVKDVQGFAIGKYTSTGCKFMLNGRSDVLQNCSNIQYDMGISIQELKVDGGIVQIQGANGVNIGSLFNANAPDNGVYLDKVLHGTFGTVRVIDANRTRNQGVIRALLFNRCEDINMLEYYLTMNDEAPLRSLEAGGGDESGVTKNVNLFYMGYINAHGTDKHDMEFQGGPFAPQNTNIYAEYLCSAEQAPQWRKTTMGALPDTVFELRDCDVNVSDQRAAISGQILNPYSFEKSVSVIAASYDENGVCLTKTMVDTTLADGNFYCKLSVNAETKKIIVYFWDSVSGMHQVLNSWSYEI